MAFYRSDLTISPCNFLISSIKRQANIDVCHVVEFMCVEKWVRRIHYFQSFIKFYLPLFDGWSLFCSTDSHSGNRLKSVLFTRNFIVVFLWLPHFAVLLQQKGSSSGARERETIIYWHIYNISKHTHSIMVLVACFFLCSFSPFSINFRADSFSFTSICFCSSDIFFVAFFYCAISEKDCFRWHVLCCVLPRNSSYSV